MDATCKITTITDFTNNKEKMNKVLNMALRNDFYFNQLWSLLMRSYPPKIKMILVRKHSKEAIEERERRAYEKYNKFGFVLNILETREGELVGFCFWDYPLPTDKNPKTGCCLEFLFISPEYRRQGLGSMLVGAFRIIAKQNFKKEKCKVQVPRNNKNLIKFYEDWGWEEGEPEFEYDPNLTEMYSVLK